jgi:hypothetical protein
VTHRVSAKMRITLCLLVLAILVFVTEGSLTDIKEGGCLLQGSQSFQDELCGDVIADFYIKSGLFTSTPGFTSTAQLPSGDCCIYNTRQNCKKVSSDLRLNVDQRADPECLRLLGVTQSSHNRYGRAVGVIFICVVFSSMMLL